MVISILKVTCFLDRGRLKVMSVHGSRKGLLPSNLDDKECNKQNPHSNRPCFKAGNLHTHSFILLAKLDCAKAATTAAQTQCWLSAPEGGTQNPFLTYALWTRCAWHSLGGVKR